MAKKIELNIKSFKSQKEAKEYFLTLKNSLQSNSCSLTDGMDFELLKEIYSKYCILESYKVERLENLKIIGFKVVKTARSSGNRYATTSCFRVNFDNNDFEEFSINRAIEKIGK